MELNMIPELINVNWKRKNDNIVIQGADTNIILNNTNSIVWMEIDGMASIEKISFIIFEKNKQDNTKDYVLKIVKESIQILLDNGLVILKVADDFGGWFQYE